MQQTSFLHECPTYMTVNITPSAGEQPIETFTSDNNSYKDFVLNPAVFSHVIEAGGAKHSAFADGSSSARRKAAPRMGVRRLNYSGDDKTGVAATGKTRSTVSAIGDHHLQNGGGFPMANNKTDRGTVVMGTLPPPLNDRRLPLQGRTLHASRLSLNVADLMKNSSYVFSSQTGFEMAGFPEKADKPFSWTKKSQNPNNKEVGIQTLTQRFCRCEELNIRREKELVRRIDLLFKLSLVGCLFFPPIGVVAISLCLKAKRLNLQRSRIGFSDPYALAMTPHFHAHQVNLITKRILFCTNAVRYSLLAETILILLTLLAYALFAGIIAKCRDLITLMLIMLVTSLTSNSNTSGNLNAYYNTNFSHPGNLTFRQQ